MIAHLCRRCVGGQLKRALWCRWFHRWRRDLGSVPFQTTTGTAPWIMVIGPTFRRTSCGACEDFDYGSRNMGRAA